MNKIYLLIATLFFLPNIAMAATNIDAAVQDICKCGYPPSSRCMDGLARKYPIINNSSELQNRVMREARTKCGWDSRGLPQKGSMAGTASIQNMVGNKNLDLSNLPMGVAGALNGIHKVVSSTQDCSTKSFKIAIPKNWQCRKQRNNPQDVTLHTNGNKLNVTVGKNQGQTSCSVIPICTSEDFELSSRFESKLYKNPMVGTYEYAGSYKQDSMFKLTITSNTKPTKAQLGQIKTILDSFVKR